MAWIKRNLLFAIGGLIALLLLGAAAYYDLEGWNHNSAAFDKLNEIYGTLKQLADQKPSPATPKPTTRRRPGSRKRKCAPGLTRPGIISSP